MADDGLDDVTGNLLAAFAELFGTLHSLQRQQPSNTLVGAAIADTNAAWSAFADYLRLAFVPPAAVTPEEET